MEPWPGVDRTTAGGDTHVEGMRRGGRGDIRGGGWGVGRGSGRQRDGKKGINQHRLHSAKWGRQRAWIRKAPSPGLWHRHPPPLRPRFPYPLPSGPLQTHTEGLPLTDAPSRPRRRSRRPEGSSAKPGLGSFQWLEAGVSNVGEFTFAGERGRPQLQPLLFS